MALPSIDHKRTPDRLRGPSLRPLADSTYIPPGAGPLLLLVPGPTLPWLVFSPGTWSTPAAEQKPGVQQEADGPRSAKAVPDLPATAVATDGHLSIDDENNQLARAMKICRNCLPSRSDDG